MRLRADLTAGPLVVRPLEASMGDIGAIFNHTLASPSQFSTRLMPISRKEISRR
jgi:hypothetical protein